MNIMVNLTGDGIYSSPSVEVYEMYTEGVICVSGSHESLKEEDDWQDLLD